MLKIENAMGPDEETILNMVEEWCGSKEAALDWYQNTEIPAFKMTAEQTMRMGEFLALVHYIKSIDQGGFA
tara:strand:- start:7601 stop:7813 length:213 start_codon:yes stop_codon:yes gene_type:complete